MTNQSASKSDRFPVPLFNFHRLSSLRIGVCDRSRRGVLVTSCFDEWQTMQEHVCVNVLGRPAPIGADAVVVTIHSLGGLM